MALAHVVSQREMELRSFMSSHPPPYIILLSSHAVLASQLATVMPTLHIPIPAASLTVFPYQMLSVPFSRQQPIHQVSGGEENCKTRQKESEGEIHRCGACPCLIVLVFLSFLTPSQTLGMWVICPAVLQWETR